MMIVETQGCSNIAASILRRWVALIAIISMAACSKTNEPKQAPYSPIEQIELAYGPLVGAANHPTGDQFGAGDRLGIFRDHAGTLWGIPLALGGEDRVLGCAPAALVHAPVTDTIPDGTLVGATNAPTGWRGGTGQLELVLRDARGQLRWYPVRGSDLPSSPSCWAQDPPGPSQRLQYYRLEVRAR